MQVSIKCNTTLSINYEHFIPPAFFVSHMPHQRDKASLGWTFLGLVLVEALLSGKDTSPSAVISFLVLHNKTSDFNVSS